MTRVSLGIVPTFHVETPTMPVDMLIAELRHLSPAERVLGLYDIALAGCARRDLDDVEAVLRELLGTLDVQYADIAESFHRLYTFCSDQANVGAFERVRFIVTDLRETLQRAVNEEALAEAESAAS